MEELLSAFRWGISGVLRGVALARTQRTKQEDPGSGKWVGLQGTGWVQADIPGAGYRGS